MCVLCTCTVSKTHTLARTTHPQCQVVQIPLLGAGVRTWQAQEMHRGRTLARARMLIERAGSFHLLSRIYIHTRSNEPASVDGLPLLRSSCQDLDFSYQGNRLVSTSGTDVHVIHVHFEVAVLFVVVLVVVLICFSSKQYTLVFVSVVIARHPQTRRTAVFGTSVGLGSPVARKTPMQIGERCCVCMCVLLCVRMCVRICKGARLRAH